LKVLPLILAFLCLNFIPLQAQDCKLSISGKVQDEHTLEILEYANIYIEETGRGIATDSAGLFKLTNLCPGNYHLRISHIGCEAQILFFKLSADTTLNIWLHHHPDLQEIEIDGRRETTENLQIENTVSKSFIEKQSGKPLGEILSSITGVTSINNGSGISKPVINGLYGNRVVILNNEIKQAGQQWGNDHAPEIDANTATQLTVIKGVGAIRYGGNALGGVVLVEPGNIPKDPHLHGSVNHVFESNGLGNTLAAKLEQSAKWLDWRINAAAKVSGDKKSPDYFLRNTGVREYSAALQLNKIIEEHWTFNFYYSYFKTHLGILRGAHIGNLTDLELAIGRDQPFFTQENRSFSIDAPSQKVQHHLAKLKVGYFKNEHQLQFTYAAQINQRDEFDVRRSGRSDIPALSMMLFSNYLEAFYRVNHNGHHINAGLQTTIEDNNNQPETGVLPLIPDYDLFNLGVFLTYKKKIKKWNFDVGGRYDFRTLNAFTITRTLPRTIRIFNPTFHNYTFAAGTSFRITEFLESGITTGWVKRSPEVNELYSDGLHQGVSGIERGDTALTSEQSLKIVWSNQINVKEKFFLEASAYFQYIKDFIFLEPQDEPELSIRGAFPVFLYKQTDATLTGLDVFAKWEIDKHWKWIAQYAMVRGFDRNNQWPLVYMPADQLKSTLSYTFKKMKKIENAEIGINGQYVFEQKKYESELDFLAPPEGYFLLGASVGSDIVLPKVVLKWSVQAENILNTTYRDYLNRLRYYSDEEGFNIRLGLNVVF
jgi:iron complex outermembrane receptor protein